MPLQSGFEMGRHSRINTGTVADSSVQLATGPVYLNGVQAFNFSSAQLFILKLYDSSGGTVSTTLVPVWRAAVPFAGALSSGSLTDLPSGAGMIWDASRQLAFKNGLMYAICITLADNANTTGAANLAVVNMQVEGPVANYISTGGSSTLT